MCVIRIITQYWREATIDVKQEVHAKRAGSLRNTWDERGVEIMKKQNSTFLSNSAYTEYADTVAEELVKSLNQAFNI